MTYLSEDFCKKHMYPLTLTLFSSVYSVALICAFWNLTSSLLWFSLLFPLLMFPIHFLSVQGKPFLFFLVFPCVSALVIYLFIRTIGSLDVLLFAYTEWWNDSKYTEQLPPYILIMLLPATLVISLIYLLQRTYIGRLLAVILEFSILLAFLFTKHATGKVSVIFCLGSFLYLLLETTLRISLRKNRLPETPSLADTTQQKTPAYAFQYWPVVILTMLLLIITPNRPDPIRWSYLKFIWNTVTSAANDAYHYIRTDVFHLNDDFTLKFSGYNNSGKLGGELLATDADYIQVVSTKRKVDSIYLSGNSKNIYTGNSWESQLDIPDHLANYSDSYLDAAELAYAVVRSGSYQDRETLFLENEYAIKFLDYRSSTLFSAAKTTKINILHPYDASYNTLPDSYQFKRRMKTDTDYHVYFNQPNLGSNEFLKLATTASYAYNNSFCDNPEDMELFFTDYSILPVDGSLDSLLLSRKNMIYNNYLVLPDSLPQRVYDLADILTKNQTSDYEKMRALEAYLQTLVYTTTPETPPENQDLVDFFLFESPEGYCTYFATALSVMGRCIGIPTRYVQGYCTGTPSRYAWTIRSRDAHAWTEAYIDGLGWIPFDATPGYTAYRYQPWSADSSVPTLPPDAFSDWLNNTTITGIPEITPQPEEEQNTNWLIALPVLAGSIITILVILAVYILYRSIKLNHFLKHSSEEDFLYYEATQIFMLYELLFDVSKPEMLFADVTLYEFSLNLIKEHTEITASALRFCDIYSAVRYGNHPATREQCTDVLTYKSQLLSLIAEKKGKRKVFQYRIARLFRN